jgi:hypothetical protein
MRLARLARQPLPTETAVSSICGLASTRDRWVGTTHGQLLTRIPVVPQRNERNDAICVMRPGVHAVPDVHGITAILSMGVKVAARGNPPSRRLWAPLAETGSSNCPLLTNAPRHVLSSGVMPTIPGQCLA